jgi:hypothetical protein
MKACLRFCIAFFMVSLLLPVRAVFSEEKPSIRIVSPEKNSTVSSRITLQFSVENFTLTTRAEEDGKSGVINVYVNGAFFENFATSSAQITLPRQGTHFIEAELVKTSRESFVPRIVDTMYVSVVKQTPHLRISNIAKDQTIYESRPTLEIPTANFDFREGYYQVFVDGVVDGDSKLLENVESYPLLNNLTEGKHTLKLALYSSNGKPVLPVVEYTLPFIYTNNKPEILRVDLPKEVAIGEAVPFKVELNNFTLGKDGLLSIVDGQGKVMLFETSEGEIKGLSSGANKLSFTLYDVKGRPLFAEAPSEKVVLVKDGLETPGSGSAQNGIFTLPQDGAQPQWMFISLAFVEACAILTFAILLFKKHKH